MKENALCFTIFNTFIILIIIIQPIPPIVEWRPPLISAIVLCYSFFSSSRVLPVFLCHPTISFAVYLYFFCFPMVYVILPLCLAQFHFSVHIFSMTSLTFLFLISVLVMRSCRLMLRIRLSMARCVTLNLFIIFLFSAQVCLCSIREKRQDILVKNSGFYCIWYVRFEDILHSPKYWPCQGYSAW